MVRAVGARRASSTGMSDEEWLTPEQATDEIQAALGRHEVVTVNKVR